jgi:hypothetical protein
VESLRRPDECFANLADYPFAPGGQVRFIQAVPGAKGQSHAILKRGSHFVQENTSKEYAEALVRRLESMR